MKRVFPLLFLLAACSTGSDPQTEAASDTAHVKQNPASPGARTLEEDLEALHNIGVSPDGEMLPGLAFPKSLTEDRDAGVPPTGKDALLKMARKSIEKGDLIEAMAVIDVLVLTHSKDPDVLEFRAKILKKQGLTEDASVDLAKCCDLGRQSCCR